MVTGCRWEWSVWQHQSNECITAKAGIAAASTLQIDRISRHSMCEHYVRLGFHLHWSIWGRVHPSALLSTEESPSPDVPTSGFTTARRSRQGWYAADTNISTVLRFPTATAISLFTPTPQCQRALCLTCENVKALLYSHIPPLQLFHGQQWHYNVRKSFPCDYLCKPLNLSFIDLLLK